MQRLVFAAMTLALGHGTLCAQEVPPPTAAAPSAATSSHPESDFNPNTIWLQGLLQMRYVHTMAAPSQNPRFDYALREDVWARRGDGFRLRRLYLRASAAPSAWFYARILLDFAKFAHGDPKALVRQAFGRVAFIPEHVELSVGVVKQPYSIMKLDAAARYEFADPGAATELVRDLDFAGRDVGALLMLAPLANAKLLRVYLGAFRGHAKDEHASPLGATVARLESKPLKGLRLGVSLAHHLYDVHYKRPFKTGAKDVLPAPTDPLYPRERSWARGNAWGADITYHRKRVMLRAEGLLGDRVDTDTRYGARVFTAVWALLAYRIRLGETELQPAARAEWLDADLDHEVGVRRSLSVSLNWRLTPSVRLLFDVTHTEVEDGSPLLDSPEPLPALPYYELDHTRAVGQLQVEI